MIRALFLVDERHPGASANGRILAAALQDDGRIMVEASRDSAVLEHLGSFDAVIHYASVAPLTATEERSLCDFVRQGGGLVTVHAEPADPKANDAYFELIGGRPATRGPLAELRVERSPKEHYVTQRLDETYLLTDEFAPFNGLVEGVDVLFTTTWQYAEHPIAWSRAFGAGRVFCTSLGHSHQTVGNPTFQKIIRRAVRYVTGAAERAAVGVGVVGYGPSGGMGYWHGSAVEAVPGLRLAAACDRSAARRQRAHVEFPGIRTYVEAEQMADDPDVGLAIIATPPSSHAKLAELFLQAGRHVVCEKPFCVTTAEADRLIDLATARGLMLSVHQNRRWDRDFLAVERAVQTGLIGEIFSLESFIGGFEHPCKLWHSHSPISGGMAYDWGSHYLDWIQILMPVPISSVTAVEHKRVWHDVTNADQVRIQLRFADGREAEFLQSDVAAVRKPKWYVLGTRGALVGNWRQVALQSQHPLGDLIDQQLAVSEVPADLSASIYDSAGGLIQQRLPLAVAVPNAFHRNLADHLLYDEPLAVTAEQARRTVALLEAAQRSASSGAVPGHAGMLTWGVLCTSFVGRQAVIPALQRSANGRVLALGSRDLERARQEADRCDIPRAYGSYLDLLDDPDIEAVYIPLPNSLHLEWVVRAAEAGKHVLCEKPLALNAAEVEAMITACERKGVHLMEAFMYRFHPRSIRVKELVDSGELGPIQLIRSAFAFLHHDPDDYRLKKAMGGGSLLDVGGYAVSAARWLIGAEPVEVQASACYGEASGIDETLGGLLRFPDGEIAQIMCSFRTALRQNYEVVGRDAALEVALAFIPEGAEAPLVVLRDGGVETERFPKVDQYQLMVEHFAEAVLRRQPLRFPPTEAWANARVLDALARAARTGELQRLKWS